MSLSASTSHDDKLPAASAGHDIEDHDTRETILPDNTFQPEKVEDTAILSTLQDGNQQYLEAPPFHRPNRPLSPDTFNNLSIDEYDQLRPRSTSPNPFRRAFQDDESGPEKIHHRAGWRSKLKGIWIRNLGLLYMLVAMLFGTLMNVTTRTLEIEGNKGKGLHPFQVSGPAFPKRRVFHPQKD